MKIKCFGIVETKNRKAVSHICTYFLLTLTPFGILNKRRGKAKFPADIGCENLYSGVIRAFVLFRNSLGGTTRFEPENSAAKWILKRACRQFRKSEMHDIHTFIILENVLWSGKVERKRWRMLKVHFHQKKIRDTRIINRFKLWKIIKWTIHGEYKLISSSVCVHCTSVECIYRAICRIAWTLNVEVRRNKTNSYLFSNQKTVSTLLRHYLSISKNASHFVVRQWNRTFFIHSRLPEFLNCCYLL